MRGWRRISAVIQNIPGRIFWIAVDLGFQGETVRYSDGRHLKIDSSLRAAFNAILFKCIAQGNSRTDPFLRGPLRKCQHLQNS